jgi:hypothetical protein
MWTYKSVDVFPAGPVVFDGLRWYARIDETARRMRADCPAMLRASTKQGMRQIINHYLKES